MYELALQLAIPAGLLILGIWVGGNTERRHLRDLDRRHKQFAHITVTNLKRVPGSASVGQSQMVASQVVIATDYFKSFATRLRNLVGGEMKSAQTLLIRARREALLRLLEQTEQMGANELWNVRFAFSNINQMNQGRNKGAMQVEMLAYGTAVVREQAGAIRADILCEQCSYNLRGIAQAPRAQNAVPLSPIYTRRRHDAADQQMTPVFTRVNSRTPAVSQL